VFQGRPPGLARTRRQYVERPIFDQFTRRLKQAAEKLKPGNPFEASTALGPLISQVYRDKVLNDGAEVKFENFCVPRVEPELTFILKAPLKDPGIGLIDVLRATEYVVPSIEIIDARVTEPRKIFDTVADNGTAADLAAGVVGHPAMAIAWLANRLAPFDITLQPGDLMLSGSFTWPVWAAKGDTLHVDFGPLGSVSVQFV
jgi:2-oxo-hept-3-ene-1,7-dioate hydratase